MYIFLIAVSLMSFLSVFFCGRLIGREGAKYISVGLISICALSSWVVFYEIVLNQSVISIVSDYWVVSDLFQIRWSFLFDSLTAVMLVVVTTVSMLVHLYSTEYMSNDPHLIRFLSYLSLFTFFMLLLVTGANFFQLFVGWEGVGLCSYLLISFWSTRIQANKAAIKAMVVNRIGDLGLCMGLFLSFYVVGTLQFDTFFGAIVSWMAISSTVFGVPCYLLTAIALLLFIGSIGKSAQFGLHTWLPDAMEGPTPVSALIHAATMVTAGVFLILRCSFVFELSSTALLVVTFVGAVTAIFAASIGLTQNDLKKVIAYSTCSQLGYMVFATGVSNYDVSLFHLANHAFFKALLFLSAGAIIHAVSDEQDMRRLGGLLQILPFSYTMMLIGSLSLMGFPFMTGFYSKDNILETAFAGYTIHAHFAYWIGTVSALFTAFYSFRLIVLSFYNKPALYKRYVEVIHEPGIAMSLVLFVLALPSIFIGWYWKDIFIGMGSSAFQNVFFVFPSTFDIADGEFIPLAFKLLPVCLSLMGALIAFVLYFLVKTVFYKLWNTVLLKKVYSFSNQKWYIDVLYNSFIVKPLLHFGGNISYVLVDKGYLEYFGPYGVIVLVKTISARSSLLQSGYVHHSFFFMLCGIVIIIGYLLNVVGAITIQTGMVLLLISIYVLSILKK